MAKKFGFGCMRLPMIGDEVDYEQFGRMIKRFFDGGFTYFDTAHGYISEKSEIAVRECLTKVYPRDSYTLTDKLSAPYIKKEEDIRPFFENQLACCGVDYFDYYLVHAVSAQNYDRYQETHAFEIVQELKKEGKIRHVGFSFHDTAEMLDRVLTDHPEVEYVQLQFNYIDYADDRVQSGACYDVCVKHGKPVIVMEPVKGGSLVNLPEEAKRLLEQRNNGSVASYAIRYAASFPNVFMVLSGMSNMEQAEDNCSFMEDFQPLNEEEQAAIAEVVAILNKQDSIPCTGCSYCTDGCPMQIPIPSVFSAYNSEQRYGNGKQIYAWRTNGKGKASECVECGACEGVCPQQLPIRELLKKCAKMFE